MPKQSPARRTVRGRAARSFAGRFGTLTLLATLVLFLRATLLLWQGSIVRLGDFGWFWWPMTLLRSLDSSWRMGLAWTRQPVHVDGGPALLMRTLEALGEHLPILLALSLVTALLGRILVSRGARPSGASAASDAPAAAPGVPLGQASWVGPALLLFLLPDLALGGYDLAVRWGADPWIRRLATWVGAIALLALAARPVARACGRLERTAAIRIAGGALLAAALLTPLAALLGPVPNAAAAGRPNILLISIDSLRADHLGSYGYTQSTSPHIDRLAAEGARFEVAQAPSSWTLPSHVTLLTGLPPVVHGVHHPEQRLAGAAETLAERLGARGYRTAGLISGYFLDASFGYSQGFDSYDDFTLELLLQDVDPLERLASPGIERLFREHSELWRRPGTARPPLFFFVHLYDVHFDYLPPEPYDRMFAEGPGFDVSGYLDNPRIHRRMPATDLAHVISQYDGEIRATDALIGTMVSELEAAGALDDTIVVVTSDHGQEFFEHGDKGHRSSLFEEQIRIPLVIRYPRRVPAGTIAREPVGLEDVGATLLGLAGIREPFGLSGSATLRGSRDLSGRLARGGRPAGDDAEPATYFGSLHETLYSVRSGPFKLILDLRRERPRKALFHLDLDPGESRDVRIRYPAEAEALRLALREHLALREGGALSVRRGLPEDLTEGLRSLGYLD